MIFTINSAKLRKLAAHPLLYTRVMNKALAAVLALPLAACVEQMSRVLTDRGLRCVLFTDLANPTSNAIYRRIGYEVAAEILGYDFA